MERRGKYASSFNENKRSSARIIFSAIIFFSFIINLLVPRFFVNSLNLEFFEKIIQSQTIVFEYFSFTKLPLEIVNSLFSTNRSCLDLKAKCTPGSKKKPANSGCGDFSFISIKRIQNIMKNPGIAHWGLTISAALPICLSGLPKSNSSSHPIGALAVFLSILLYISLLPRSSLNDSAVISGSFAGFYTRFEKSNRVFLFNANNNANLFLNIRKVASKDFIYFPDGRENGWLANLQTRIGGWREEKRR